MIKPKPITNNFRLKFKNAKSISKLFLKISKHFQNISNHFQTYHFQIIINHFQTFSKNILNIFKHKNFQTSTDFKQFQKITIKKPFTKYFQIISLYPTVKIHPFQFHFPTFYFTDFERNKFLVSSHCHIYYWFHKFN